MAEFFSGAHSVIRSLMDVGCNTYFVYPGGAILPVFDVMREYESHTRAVVMRHEQSLAHAATAYARVARQPAVCMVTSGPGVSNLVSGMADAMTDATPLIAISGQVKSSLIGTGAFQEIDVVSLMAPICKSVRLVTEVTDISSAILDGYQIATQGRPGPVMIDISVDTFHQETMYTPSLLPAVSPVDALKHETLEEVADALNAAQRPLIIAGQGVLLSGAESVLLSLTKKSGIPVVTTLMAQELNYVGCNEMKGLLGMQGNYAPTTLSNDADVVLVLGARLMDRVHCGVSDYLSQARVIQVDIDDQVFNQWIDTQWCIQSDINVFLQQLLPRMEARRQIEWNQRFSDLAIKEENEVVEPSCDRVNEPLTMVEVIISFSHQLKEDIILVTDVGEHQMIAAKYFRSSYGAQLITSGGYGVMGFGLPAAIGAKIANPDKLVVLVVGDGGFQMTLQELEVLKQESLDIKIIVMDNNRLGMVSFWQDQFFSRHHAYSEVSGPDFKAVAQAYGLLAQSLSERGEMASAFHELLSSSSAYVLHVHTDPKEGCFPIVPLGSKRVEMVFR